MIYIQYFFYTMLVFFGVIYIRIGWEFSDKSLDAIHHDYKSYFKSMTRSKFIEFIVFLPIMMFIELLYVAFFVMTVLFS